jgi:hypothetical protein
MRAMLLATIGAAARVASVGAAALLLPGLARADTVDLDPLHSVVCNSTGMGCVNTDNQSFAPIAGDVTRSALDRSQATPTWWFSCRPT